MGAENFGYYFIFVLSVGFIGFVDLGVPRAVIRQTALSRSNSSQLDLAPLTNGLAIAVGGGLGWGLLIWIVGTAIEPFMEWPAAPMERVFLFGVLGLAIAAPIMAVTNLLNGFLQATDGFLEMNLWAAAATILSQLGPLLMLEVVGVNLPALFATFIAARFVIVPALFWSCRRRGGRIRSDLLGRERIGEMLRYGGWISLSGFVGPLMLVSDRYLIVTTLGGVAASRYSVPYQLAQSIMIVPTAIQSVLFPTQSAIDPRAQMALTRSATRAVAVIMFIVFGCAILTVGPLLPLLLRDAFHANLVPVAQVILIGFWINSIAFVPFTQLQADGRVRTIALVHLAELPLYAFGLYVGLELLGLLGAAMAFALRCALDAAIFNRLTMASRSDLAAFAAMMVGLLLCLGIAASLPLSLMASLAVGPVSIVVLGLAGYCLLTPELREGVRTLRS